MTDDPTPSMEAVDHLLDLEPPTLRKADVEALTGVPDDRSARWWRALGFPEVADDERAFRHEDVEMVRRLDLLLQGDIVDEGEVMRLARLMGASSSRLVEAQLEVVDELFTDTGATTGSSNRRLDPEALATVGGDIMENLETTLVYVWRRHLLAALGRRLTVAEEHAEQAIGFADLSGFSRVTKKASSAEIADIIDTFETIAFDVVSVHGGRVVKLIGDEAMFVTTELDDALAIGLDLIARLQPIEIMPAVHCGIAWGPTVTVGGDVFGPTVNLASRLTDVAKRGTIAVPAELVRKFRDRDDVDVRRVRRSYDLKGVGRTTIAVIRSIPADRTDAAAYSEGGGVSG